MEGKGRQNISAIFQENEQSKPDLGTFFKIKFFSSFACPEKEMIRTRFGAA
jgi:hypothetical protein